VNEHFCTIVKVEPESLLSFEWIPYELSPGEDGTKHPRTHVEFLLEEIPHGTRLTVSESGFAKLPADKQYKRDENGRGWAVQAHAIAQHVLGKILVSVEQRIAVPVADVREAIVDPARMAKYFLSHGSGRMESGAKLQWAWSDSDAKTDVMVRQAEPDKIVFLWGANEAPTQVEITLSDDKGGTAVHVIEHPFELSEESAKRAIGQTQGWTQFCCGLKAYLEHGIDLRHGVRGVA
jgi:uncharacterized protein YndB with AHSA1/START domain